VHAAPFASLTLLLAPREGGNSMTIFLVQLLLFLATHESGVEVRYRF